MALEVCKLYLIGKTMKYSKFRFLLKLLITACPESFQLLFKVNVKCYMYESSF